MILLLGAHTLLQPDTHKQPLHFPIPALASHYDKVLKRMDESYSFHDMPMPVLEKILQRMSRGSERSITTSTSNNYKLIKNLDVELATFKLQEHTAQAETHDIIAALTDWLRKVSPEMKADENIVSIWLGDFFDARGVDVLFDIDELRADTIKNTTTVYTPVLLICSIWPNFLTD